METEELLKNFALLKHIVEPGSAASGGDLAGISRLIETELPEALEDNAPPNFPRLYFDFKYEFERFKQFILFDKLIGRNIVALGGGFSSGKSSFINSLMGKSILPADINPSTSVPTYLISGEPDVCGINVFGNRVELDIEDVKLISHGFGKTDDDDSETTLGHILESVFISTEEQAFKNIALLDTPGYSKPDSADYSAKTDENIARVQLNSSNYILWFVQADSGIISSEDISFLESLNKDIPKLIIVNKADKLIKKDLDSVVNAIREVLDMKAVPYVDILTYSRRTNFECDRDKIIARLNEWDKQVFESRFAYNFKVLFTKCKEFYDHELEEESMRLAKIKKSETLSDNSDVIECLEALERLSKRRKTDLEEHRGRLKELQNSFFTEIKRIGDKYHIEMPEPSEIDLIRDKISDPEKIVREYCEKKGVSAKKKGAYVEILNDVFADIKPVFKKAQGGSDFADVLVKVLEENLNIDPKKIKFDHGAHGAEKIASKIQNAMS